MIPGVLTEIRSDHLPNASVNNYRYITLLGPSGCICREIGEHPNKSTEHQVEDLEEEI
jgi:hypothetical protein